jgi:hypothetical protein
MSNKDINPVVRALLNLPPEPPPPQPGLFNFIVPSLPAPRLPVAAAIPKAPIVPIERLSYFAFDFDDIIRVNNVRQSGKIGPRVNGNSRGFKDRSIWDKSNAKTNDGLKGVMRRGVNGSGVVCVLVGSNTWQSFWVRYEIALAVIGERGLLAVDLNSINHHERKAPDALGVNPLHFMGVFNDGQNWYLVERKMVETANGPELQWDWYSDYTRPVRKPLYIPDLANKVMPLSPYTTRYDYMGNWGSSNLGHWLDAAAKRAGR